jgi:hypothetical protein
MSQALVDGKIIWFNSGPEVMGRGTHPARNAVYALQEPWMKEHIRFPVAAFPDGGGGGHFFSLE